ncbi:MAG: hypothetical protein ACTSPD_09980 [Promethearchaeota archaeon]
MSKENQKNKFKNHLFAINIDTYLEIIELAKKHGKKPGDSMQEEFIEVIKKKKAKYLGGTNKDKDLLTGDLREEGLRILNLDELQRKKDNNGKRKQ